MKLKIGAKLLAGFMAVAVITGFIGIFASFMLKYLDDKDTMLYEKGLLPVYYIGSVVEHFHRIRVNMHKILLADTKDEINQLLKDIDGYKNENGELIKKYETTLFTDEGRTIFKKFNKDFDDYRQNVVGRFVVMASENRIEEAKNFLMVEALAQANAIQKELEDLYANKIEQSKKIVDSNTDTANLTIIIMISITIAAFITAIALGLTLTLSITKPLIRATGISQKIADGDLRDELSSNFDKKIIKRSDEIGDLVRSVDTVIINFNNLLSEVQSVSDGILSGANQVSSAAQSLSQGSSELASSIEEMSSSIEEMESTIDQNSDNAVEGEKIATKSSQEAKDGGEAVNQTVESMKKIADTIQIITEIANNTNMLALNAAIEAARAGEHGEGFAVVATEVRKLAERSLKAAEEIKKIATSSVQVATKAGDLINQVVPSIIKTSDMVQEIASASREQKSGMKQLRQAANQQEQVTQLVSANSEELASAAEESASQAQSLVDLVKAFKLKEDVKTTTIKKDNPKLKQTNIRNTNNITGVLPSPKQKLPESRQKFSAKNEDDYSDIDDSTDFIQL